MYAYVCDILIKLKALALLLNLLLSAAHKHKMAGPGGRRQEAGCRKVGQRQAKATTSFGRERERENRGWDTGHGHGACRAASDQSF